MLNVKKELSFSDMLNKSRHKSKARCFKVANRYENIQEAKEEVLKILNSQRNFDNYRKEYREDFIISIDSIKYDIKNDKIHLTCNEKNQELKLLYLYSINNANQELVISIAELINKYNKREVKFLTHKNTRLGDIYTQIIL